MCNWVIATTSVLFLSGFWGCSAHQAYDLSGEPPFPVAKSFVALARPALLICWNPGNSELREMMGTDELESIEKLSDSYFIIPTGTTVEVISTRLQYNQQGIIQGFFATTNIASQVIVTVDKAGWPQTVEAYYGYSFYNQTTAKKDAKLGPIFPAPWDSKNNPALIIQWPDERHRIK